MVEQLMGVLMVIMVEVVMAQVTMRTLLMIVVMEMLV